jgi:hypothetical protein
MALSYNVGKDRFAKNNGRKMLTVVALTLVLSLVAIAALTMSVFGSSSVARADELQESHDTLPVEMIVNTRVLSQSDVTFDPNAFDYQGQLAKAGLADINPLDYGMEVGDRLLRASTTTFETTMEFIISHTAKLKATIKGYVDHWSWGGGFLNMYIKSANDTTINYLKYDAKLPDSSLRLSDIKVELWQQAGSKNESVSGESVPASMTTTIYSNSTTPPILYEQNISHKDSVRGFGWGHWGNGKITAVVLQANGAMYGTASGEAKLFGF